MQKSYSIGLILLIYITIKYKNVVFELLAGKGGSSTGSPPPPPFGKKLHIFSICTLS